MDKESIVTIISKYNSGSATEEDIIMIERLLESGALNLEQLHDFNLLDEKLQRFEYPSPSKSLDTTFYKMLSAEKRGTIRFDFKDWFNFSALAPRLAFASVTFLAGLVLGYILFQAPAKNGNELQALSKEVNSLKELMMLSLLENESATDRLKAVSLTQDMTKASESVTKALITTLNKDENVNVRLAALEALIPYTNDSNIRTEIIKSIAQQDSPLVQIALANLMAGLQEKSSIKEFQKVLEDEKTPEEVKKRIREKIEIMI